MSGRDRLIDYFVCSSCDDYESQLQSMLAETSEVYGSDLPITDLAVIFPTCGDSVPDGFEVIDRSYGGQSADLNGGRFMSKICYICVERKSNNRQPIIDIKLIKVNESDIVEYRKYVPGVTPESPTNKTTLSAGGRTILKLALSGYIIIKETPSGLPANLNMGRFGPDIFMAFRRQADVPTVEELYRSLAPIVEVAVLQPGNTTPPPGFFMDPTNVNEVKLSRTPARFHHESLNLFFFPTKFCT